MKKLSIILMSALLSNVATSQNIQLHKTDGAVITVPLSELDSITFTNKVTVSDIDGNIYNTVTIGTQVWMQGNLKVTKYRNGDAIPATSPATKDISGEASPKYQWAYNGDNSNVATYGRLYTWYVATDSREVCPTGWHVPSDTEWKTLTDYLGGADSAGGKMKESGTAHWQTPNLAADNSSGFTALPSGYRFSYGQFDCLGGCANWWLITDYNTANAWAWSQAFGHGKASLNYDDKKRGFGVRCLKD